MKKQFLLSVSILLLVAGVFYYLSKTKKETEHTQSAPLQDKTTGFHAAFSMDKSFYGNIEKIVPASTSEEKIYGGIVSHHLLVAGKIAQFFSAFQKQAPKTIIIVGPNHFNVGNGDILISKYLYKTPWGIVSPEEKYINELLDKKIASNDEAPFSNEHSISALVSFIKYYLPNTKIIPIIIKRGTTKERTALLAKNLNEILPSDAVVISSVDFSHHLGKLSANFHDEKSISAIKNFNYPGVFSSEIDSPPSIYALLLYLKMREAEKMIGENTNSADFMDNPYFNDVTSYLFAHFIKGHSAKNENISILNFGDMMFARDVEKSLSSGINPFEKIKGPEGNFLRGIDLISANLEGPITDNIDCVKKAYSFKFKQSVTSLIAKSNVNIVNLANNHISDCKEQGVIDTKNYLTKNNIDFFGDPIPQNSFVEKEINGKKIALIGIDTTTHTYAQTQYLELIRKLKEGKRNDYVIVNIHWGYEYHDNPSQEQKDIAHLLIDNGADLIIGHHPHVIQPMEIYENKVIFYSLGNFIFDQVGEKTNTGLGVGTIFENEKTKFYLFPYNIKKYQPTLFLPEQAKAFCNKYLSNAPNTNECYFEIK